MTDDVRTSSRRTTLAVIACLALTATLAVTSLIGDSVTYDETLHLVSGVSHLETGDFRLASDHPPLASMWAALPILFVPHERVPTGDTAWKRADFESIGRRWLFELNDAQTLIVAPRLMIVAALVMTCLTIFAMTRIVFGTRAALLALFVASLSPTLLAHGRLVTADVVTTLLTLLTLLTFHRLLAAVTVPRLLATAAAASGLVVSKLSWPLLLPALIVMAVVRVREKTPLPAFGRVIPSSGGRLVAVLGVATVISAIVWGSVWAVFGFQYSAFRGDDRDRAILTALRDGQTPPTDMSDVWTNILRDEDGEPLTGTVVTFIKVAREHRLLPEVYLYSIARTNKQTKRRAAFLHGDYSETGFRTYFPIAFAIKTPIPIMILTLAGVAAVVTRRVTPWRRAPSLCAGLLSFFVIYAAGAITSHINIGHRHILPLYPVLFVLVGGAAAWASRRPARWGGLALLGWLLAANLWIHPHYLSYFNEIIGGPGRGHHWLADSNIDWGQDLGRLARDADTRDGDRIKLAYFGSAMPETYGFPVSDLASRYPFQPRASLSGGTYVVSVTELLGVYNPKARASFWQSERNVRTLAWLEEQLRTPLPPTASPDDHANRVFLERNRAAARAGLLLMRLRTREPDRRIGYSMFVYELSDEDVAELTRPVTSPGSGPDSTATPPTPATP